MTIAIAPMMLSGCLASPKLPYRQMQRIEMRTAPIMPCAMLMKTFMLKMVSQIARERKKKCLTSIRELGKIKFNS